VGSQALEHRLLKLENLIDQLGDRAAVWIIDPVLLEISPDSSRHTCHVVQVQLLESIEKTVEHSQLPSRSRLPAVTGELSRHMFTVAA
jgi:hypothetical protein